jgi:hypothetical protein
MSVKVDEQLLSYLAGFFDGEGCIGVTPGTRTSYYLLQVSVSNTKREVLDLYQDLFDGKIIKCKRGPRHKDVYVWSIHAKKAEAFLIAMHGRLRLKREQLELALEFRELFKGQNVLPRGNSDLSLPQHQEKRENVIALREVAYFKMKELNKRGVDLDESASGS